MIQIKRVYEERSPDDGYRILVDRLWPRGVSKEKAHLDLWLKDIAPSDALRRWFAHDAQKWPEFEKRYKKELNGKQDLVQQIKALEKEHHHVTILFGAKDTAHNEAVVLLHILQSL